MAYNIDVSHAKRHAPLAARVYQASPKTKSSERAAVLTILVDFLDGDSLDPVLESILHDGFNREIDGGRTYPQEHTVNAEGFRSYFLAYDLIVGFSLSASQLEALGIDFSTCDEKELFAGTPLSATQLSQVGLGRTKLSAAPAASAVDFSRVDLSDWTRTYAFSCYIKPNYPGRSSHLCNGGFMVPETSRGLGLGQIAGRSFLYYAPGCGYRGSVFNLVYTTNVASVRIWEGLGFRTVGILPEAGRLKTVDGKAEEYDDAAIVHGDFRKIGLYNSA